jgi:PIN domain nuclease of toxin-antitoxin system
LSAATVWELATKQARGHLRLPGLLVPAISQNGFTALAIDAESAELTAAL